MAVDDGEVISAEDGVIIYHAVLEPKFEIKPNSPHNYCPRNNSYNVLLSQDAL